MATQGEGALERVVSKGLKKKVTLKKVELLRPDEEASAKTLKELTQLCENHKWQVIAVPTDNNNGHNYTVGQPYIIKIFHNAHGTFSASSLDGSFTGNHLDISDCEFYLPIEKKNAGKNGKILDRLVISDEYRQLILDTVNQASPDVQAKIFEEWGFGETIEKGKGIIILLYGPPGTGKTMCAEGITEMLDKDFIILNSGSVQSNIPGQTERNIQEAFTKATRDNLVLILDECDSLIYNRDEVGAILSAEINALLTELERFEGVCILTTNRSERLDPALERRVCLKLKFEKPDPRIRKAIWEKLTPKQCPLGADVNFDELAAYEMTGGQIKNSLLTAARTAVGRKADKVERVDMLTGVNVELLGTKMWSTSDKYALSSSTTVKERIKRSGDGVTVEVAKEKVAKLVKKVGGEEENSG